MLRLQLNFHKCSGIKCGRRVRYLCSTSNDITQEWQNAARIFRF